MTDFLEEKIRNAGKELSDFHDARFKELLDRHRISWAHGNIEKIRKNIAAAGFDVLIEQTGDQMTGLTHTIKLVRVIDQIQYKVTTKVEITP